MKWSEFHWTLDILLRLGLRLKVKSGCSYEHDWVVALPPAAGRHDGQVVAGALQQQCVLGLEAGHGDLVERQVVQQPVGEGEVLPQPPVLPHRLLLHRHRLPGAGHRGHAAAAANINISIAEVSAKFLKILTKFGEDYIERRIILRCFSAFTEY